MRTLTAFAFMLLSGALAAAAAHAQESPLAKFQACVAVSDNASRLACYDAAAKAPLTAAPQSSVPKVAEAPAPAAAPSTASIIPAKPVDTPDSITLAISSIDPGADGKLRFTLSNGEVWRQLDTTPLKNLGKGPWTAEIRKAAMGSFMLKVNNKPPVRARRVE